MDHIDIDGVHEAIVENSGIEVESQEQWDDIVMNAPEA